MRSPIFLYPKTCLGVGRWYANLGGFLQIGSRFQSQFSADTAICEGCVMITRGFRLVKLWLRDKRSFGYGFCWYWLDCIKVSESERVFNGIDGLSNLGTVWWEYSGEFFLDKVFCLHKNGIFRALRCCCSFLNSVDFHCQRKVHYYRCYYYYYYKGVFTHRSLASLKIKYRYLKISYFDFSA